MRVLVALLMFIPSIAMAQTPPQSPPSPVEQALSQELMEVISANVNLRATIIALQKQVKELQGKPPEPPKKP